jgi:hypothetical protein
MILQLANTAISRPFFWDVDVDTFPDYYQTIRKPWMLAHIANALVTQRYGDPPAAGETPTAAAAIAAEIASRFYVDMRTVFLNCVTYNTELSTLVASAQRLNCALWRHCQRWLFGPDRLPFDCCDENHCLRSGVCLLNNDERSIKCPKCFGIFASTKLGDEPFATIPNPGDYEDWLCPYCLREDSACLPKFITPLSITKSLSSPFFLNEWGSSTAMPWILNPAHSSLPDNIPSDQPSLIPVLSALQVLCKQQQLMNTKGVKSTGECYWTIQERVRVWLGICEALYQESNCVGHIARIRTECAKLRRLGQQKSVREWELVETARAAAGEEGALLCRRLLDGFEADGTPELSIRLEGLCLVCKRSTYEEDCDDEEEVLCCDGCNGEAHLKCTNLTAVSVVNY